MPVEQPRRKIRGNDGPNRRMNMPQAKPHPANAIFKDAFGGAKIGEYNFEYILSLHTNEK